MANTQEEIKLYPIQDCLLEKNRVSLPADPSDVKHEIGTRVLCPTFSEEDSLIITFTPPFGDPCALNVRCPVSNKFCAYYNI